MNHISVTEELQFASEMSRNNISEMLFTVICTGVAGDWFAPATKGRYVNLCE